MLMLTKDNLFQQVDEVTVTNMKQFFWILNVPRHSRSENGVISAILACSVV